MKQLFLALIITKQLCFNRLKSRQNDIKRNATPTCTQYGTIDTCAVPVAPLLTNVLKCPVELEGGG